MADFRMYLTYNGTEGDFYVFRLRIANPDYYTLLTYLADFTGDDISALSWLEFAGSIPDILLEDDEIPYDNGSGTFVCPSDLYFIAAKDKSIMGAFYPTEPAGGATISTSFFNAPYLYYSATEPYYGMEVPASVDPDTYEPDENGYYFPDDWNWADIPFVYRYDSYSIDYSWVNNLWAWTYEGCDLPSYHILNHWADLTLYNNSTYWNLSNAYNIIHCNAESEDIPYYVWYESAYQTEWYNVRIWQPDTENVILFAPGLLEAPEPGVDHGWMAGLVATGFLLFNLLLPHNINTLLFAAPRQMSLGSSSNKPLGSASNKPLGSTET